MIEFFLRMKGKGVCMYWEKRKGGRQEEKGGPTLFFPGGGFGFFFEWLVVRGYSESEDGPDVSRRPLTRCCAR